MNSLSARLLLTATIVLAAFLGLTGWTLDKAFRVSVQTAMKDRLQTQIYALIAASELGKDGIIRMTGTLAEARFSVPGSGLYAQISTQLGAQVWQSPSMVGLSIPFKPGLPRGANRFELVTTSTHAPVYAYSFGLAWDVRGVQRAYTFSVAEGLESTYAQISGFRRNLWGWLGGVALLLLLVQGIILRWGLSPLRRAADDLAAIEAGKATQLEGTYPKELRRLTTNLNALIRHEREHLERYRHTLDDLAHSLKTPLAILQGDVEGDKSPQQLKASVQEQVDRMSQIVEYQLRRAASSGRTTLVTPVSVEPAVRRLIKTLNKVHTDRKIIVSVAADPGALFYGDEGDLLELLGNIIDNAFKWCAFKINITVQTLPGERRSGLLLQIEDDGPGVPAHMKEKVLRRGVRADESIQGHGIGLAIVQDIARLYSGTLKIERSALGGALLSITLPGD